MFYSSGIEREHPALSVCVSLAAHTKGLLDGGDVDCGCCGCWARMEAGPAVAHRPEAGGGGAGGEEVASTGGRDAKTSPAGTAMGDETTGLVGGESPSERSNSSASAAAGGRVTGWADCGGAYPASKEGLA